MAERALAERALAERARAEAGPSSAAAPVLIEVMGRTHLRQVAAIEAEASSHPWPLSLFRSELRMPTSRHWLVATAGGDVVGFAGLMWTLDEAHVTNFAVAGTHRRRHVAKRLLLAQLADAVRLGVRDVSLEVRASNDAAQALYRGFGFAPAGIRRGYYNDNGEDALIMWCHDIEGGEQRARLRAVEASLAEPLLRGAGAPAEETRG